MVMCSCVCLHLSVCVAVCVCVCVYVFVCAPVCLLSACVRYEQSVSFPAAEPTNHIPPSSLFITYS